MFPLNGSQCALLSDHLSSSSAASVKSKLLIRQIGLFPPPRSHSKSLVGYLVVSVGLEALDGGDMSIILAVPEQGVLWQPCVSWWDRSVFDNVVRFYHLRKSGVNEAHDPPDYLVHNVALVLPT